MSRISWTWSSNDAHKAESEPKKGTSLESDTDPTKDVMGRNTAPLRPRREEQERFSSRRRRNAKLRSRAAPRTSETRIWDEHEWE